MEVYDLARVREDRRRIARDVVLAVTQTDQQRAALAGGNDLARVAAGHDGDPVRAFDLVQRFDHRILERVVERRFDQMREHLGIGLGREHVPVLLEHPTQRASRSR